MRYSAPVMLFGDAVKAIRRATSSGRGDAAGGRAGGAQQLVGERVVLDAVLFGQPPDGAVRVGPHAGRDGTGSDGDRAHALGVELLGDDPRQRSRP
jgi:hypothetical protein